MGILGCGGVSKGAFRFVTGRVARKDPALAEFVDGFTGGFLGQPLGLLRRLNERSLAPWRPAEPSPFRLVVISLSLCLGLFAGIVVTIRIGAPKYEPVRRLLAPIEQIVLPAPAPLPALDVAEAAATTDSGAAPRAWTSVVFHHSATAGGSAQSFDAYHRTHNGWRSLGYHFVIGNGLEMSDGAVEAGPRWKRQEAGAHANSNEYNAHGIGICLVGNFDLVPPSDAQLASAKALVALLCRRYNIPASRVYGHGQIREGGGTACPGRMFPLGKIREGLPNP